MTSNDDCALHKDAIDMDRIIIDPDYRRRILARLRQARLSAESQGRSLFGEVTPQSAASD